VIDKNVYLNNVFIANYEDTAIGEIISSIRDHPREDFPGELKLRLVATDLSATAYDLFVDEVKAKDATAKCVLVNSRRFRATFTRSRRFKWQNILRTWIY
jgi:hypothetical protein